MKRRFPVIGVLITILLIALLLVIIFQMRPNAAKSFSNGSFTVNGRSFALTQIDTNLSTWELGLMNDTNITNTTFALFVFPYSSNYSFWMKNTYIALDMLWINNSHVVYIVSDAKPCIGQESCAVYTPNASAGYVLEAKAGFVQRENITIGKNISIYLH
jgi:uncharacterized protein